MPRQVKKNIRVGELSEILVLSVLGKLGSARIPQIYECLQLATEKGKAPFSVGQSIGQVLKWRERLDEVQEDTRDHVIFYTITAEGKRTVQEYDTMLRRFFPNLSKVKPQTITLNEPL